MELRMGFPVLKLLRIVVLGILVLAPFVHAEADAEVDVLNYNLDVAVSPLERSIAVVAEINLDNSGASAVEFSLNEAMLVEEVELNGRQTAYERSGNILSIPLNSPGKHAVVVKYRNVAQALKFGDLLVGYLGGPGETTFMVYRAAWYPMVFGDRATAEVRITVPSGYTPITVGEPMGIADVEGGMAYSWKTDTTMPGVSFAVGNFVEKTAIAYITDKDKAFATQPPHTSGWRANRGIEFVEIGCYLAPKDAFLADSCISNSEKILKYYARIFGGYPYWRLSVVEMPENFFGGHGAMGLILIHPSGLRGRSDDLLDHEIAHNWWGASISVKKGYNLQTLGSPNIRIGEAAISNDLWLHEGMATYSSMLFLEEARGKDSMMSSLRQKRSEYLKMGGRASISSASEDYSNGEYHATVYSKGALVLHMLRYVMGDESFYRLMESYARKYAGTSVESRDFESLASEVYGEDLSWFFDEWIRGGGLPDYAVDDVMVQHRGGKYVVSVAVWQRGDAMRMPLDVTLVTSGKTLKKRVMVEGSEAEVVFESSGEPYYVELDEGEWLIEADRTNNLRVLDYPLSPMGARLLWTRLWDARLMKALKQLVLP